MRSISTSNMLFHTYLRHGKIEQLCHLLKIGKDVKVQLDKNNRYSAHNIEYLCAKYKYPYDFPMSLLTWMYQTIFNLEGFYPYEFFGDSYLSLREFHLSENFPDKYKS